MNARSTDLPSDAASEAEYVTFEECMNEEERFYHEEKKRLKSISMEIDNYQLEVEYENNNLNNLNNTNQMNEEINLNNLKEIDEKREIERKKTQEMKPKNEQRKENQKKEIINALKKDFEQK